MATIVVAVMMMMVIMITITVVMIMIRHGPHLHLSQAPKSPPCSLPNPLLPVGPPMRARDPFPRHADLGASPDSACSVPIELKANTPNLQNLKQAYKGEGLPKPHPNQSTQLNTHKSNPTSNQPNPTNTKTTQSNTTQCKQIQPHEYEDVYDDYDDCDGYADYDGYDDYDVDDDYDDYNGSDDDDGSDGYADYDDYDGYLRVVPVPVTA